VNSNLDQLAFEYEISEADYVAGQILYCKQQFGRRYVENAIAAVLMGVVLGILAWLESVHNFAKVILCAAGIWWVYGGLTRLFPSLYLRRQYRASGLAGQKFRAEINAEGLQVTGELCAWRVRWQGLSAKGQNNLIFMFLGANTVFIFARKYLDEEQEAELCRMSGLTANERHV
jgi:hypothetical protein